MGKWPKMTYLVVFRQLCLIRMYVVLPFHMLTPHKFLQKASTIHHNICSTKQKSKSNTQGPKG